MTIENEVYLPQKHQLLRSETRLTVHQLEPLEVYLQTQHQLRMTYPTTRLERLARVIHLPLLIRLCPKFSSRLPTSLLLLSLPACKKDQRYLHSQLSQLMILYI